MKKRTIIVISIAIILIFIGIILSKKIIEKNKYDGIQYGKAEFVTSMNDINKNLPTIILFKSVMIDDSIKAERNLKLLYDEYGSKFNIVHANSDSIDNDEAIELAKKYEVKGVPTIVALDKEGNVVTKKENVYSEKGIKRILEEIGIKINN